MYNYGYSSSFGSSLGTSQTFLTLYIIFGIIALIGGIVLYALFFSNKKDGKYSGFMKWLYDFVQFRILTVETIAKVLYVISAVAVTLTAFAWFAYGAMGLIYFPLQIILGNILVRIAYEFSIMLILLVRNTNSINSKLKNQNDSENTKDPFAVNVPELKKPAKTAPANAKFCSGCGKALDPNAQFCDGCGKKCE